MTTNRTSVGKCEAIATVEYSRFAPINVRLPFDWVMDPYENRQWLHNLFTMRWMPSTSPNDDFAANPEAVRRSLAILEDFAAYHQNPEVERSEYYETRLGDLAAGIRMPILVEYYLFVNNHPEECGPGFSDTLLEEIKAEKKLMLSDNFYSKRSNHLIGLDTGILHALLLIPKLDPDQVLVGFCEGRLETILSEVFDDFGVVLEHSVHYQAYNAWLCTQYLDLCARVGRKSKLYERVCQIIATTRRVLPYAIKPNGEYHLIGDTFQRPLVRYLRTFTQYCREHVHGSVPDDETRIDQQDVSQSAMFAPNAGFASFRFQSGQNKRTKTFHLYQTSGWHSNIHKQADELSFSLYTGGGDLLIDPGYSDLEEAVASDLEAATRHNTVSSPNLPWIHRKTGSPTGGGMTGFFSKPGLAAVRTELRRIPGVLVTRILVFIQPAFLCVLDRIQSAVPNQFEQRFTFAPGATLTETSAGGFDIKREGMGAIHWRTQGPDKPVHSYFDNFLVQDQAFRSEGAKMLPAPGLCFHADGTDMALSHLIAPVGLQPWDENSFFTEVGEGGLVTIRFTWNMVRVSHAFRLRAFADNEGLVFQDI